jgi:hypothetical protein
MGSLYQPSLLSARGPCYSYGLTPDLVPTSDEPRPGFSAFSRQCRENRLAGRAWRGLTPAARPCGAGGTGGRQYGPRSCRFRGGCGAGGRRGGRRRTGGARGGSGVSWGGRPKKRATERAFARRTLMSGSSQLHGHYTTRLRLLSFPSHE